MFVLLVKDCYHLVYLPTYPIIEMRSYFQGYSENIIYVLVAISALTAKFGIFYCVISVMTENFQYLL